MIQIDRRRWIVNQNTEEVDREKEMDRGWRQKARIHNGGRLPEIDNDKEKIDKWNVTKTYVDRD